MSSSKNSSTSNTAIGELDIENASSNSLDSKILLTMALPCYNMAEYMDDCIESILAGAKNFLDKIEIIIVDDGSNADNTAEKADDWQKRFPQIIRAIHQENGGHGQAVNTGLENARGTYFKVVDSDDWLDEDGLSAVLIRLKWLDVSSLDLLITNYVYENLSVKNSKPIKYKGVLPTDRVFGWGDIGKFKAQQNLLNHSLTYRTQLLKDIKLKLPKHTFYVDNIFAYAPLPAVKSIYYLDINLYHYRIGREGQSVNESVMIKRIEQQLKITRIMIDAHNLNSDVLDERLRRYMTHYLSMMMTICCVFLRLSDRDDSEQKRREILDYLKASDAVTYAKVRGSALGIAANLPGIAGKNLSILGYRIAQKLFKFN